MADNKQEFVSLFNEIVKRQTVVLGPDIATIIARKVQGLKIADDGTITDFDGDPQELLQNLINGYVNLSGLIVRKTIEPLLAKHPSAAARAVSTAAASTANAVDNNQEGK
jgi:hypothetical protein